MYLTNQIVKMLATDLHVCFSSISDRMTDFCEKIAQYVLHKASSVKD